MSKRTSFTALAGGKPYTPTADSSPTVSALLHNLASNPDNPRDPDELELDEMVDSFREVGQLQPVLVVSRDVYLKHKPDNATAVGDAQYVVLGGNRRLEAARQLGWARLGIQVRDDLGDGEGSLDEAVIIENIHRKALAPMKEATFLQTMVDRYGSQTKVAQRIGKTQAYVSQRLSLLKLEPELQQAVDSGELKVKQARRIAAVPQGEQRAAWQETATVAPSRPDTSVGHNPVMTQERKQEPAAVPSGVEVPASPPPPAPVPAVPEPRPEPAERPVIKMPWADGQAAMDIVFDKLLIPERDRAIARYLERLGDADDFARQLESITSPEYRQQLAKLLTHQP